MTRLPENYIIRVLPEKRLKISELKSVSEKIKDSEKKYFCLIPYSNPSKKKPVPQFYQVVNESTIGYTTPDAITTSFLLKARTTKEKYISSIKFLKDQIQRGNIYEINYCVEFVAEDSQIDPLQIFLRLNELTKAPYSSLVKIENDFIISGSPELFLKKVSNRLFSKPIKGTSKRGGTMEEDLRLKEQLHNSSKERTENVMAVDVARNDLSRVAARGTVGVNDLYHIETYETVHHMVSTVSCEIPEDISFQTIIDATFPMASMTGAPKVKAMELIDATENFDRRFYSGAMGLIEENGDFELSVNIRCIFYNQETGKLSIAVGSAITHLCDPEKEYEECLLKANALLRALNAKVKN
jgi:para-aminobenzoate synthetase component 1